MSEWLWTSIPYTDVPIVLVVVLVGLWFVLRNRATDLGSASALDARIGQGRPVVLEFFSNT